MCLFITVTLPQSSKEAPLEEIAVRHRRALVPLPNSGVEACLRVGERSFLTTRGHCDCGTSLGALRRSRGREREHDLGPEVAKLRREGWSEAKVARWLAEKGANEQDPKNTARLLEGTLTWHALLTEMLGSGSTSSVGLLLHWYDGSLSEPFRVKERQVIALNNLVPDFLGNLEEDILYEFKV